jgi:hypothetical protein
MKVLLPALNTTPMRVESGVWDHRAVQFLSRSLESVSREKTAFGKADFVKPSRGGEGKGIASGFVFWRWGFSSLASGVLRRVISCGNSGTLKVSLRTVVACAILVGGLLRVLKKQVLGAESSKGVSASSRIGWAFNERWCEGLSFSVVLLFFVGFGSLECEGGSRSGFTGPLSGETSGDE